MRSLRRLRARKFSMAGDTTTATGHAPPKVGAIVLRSVHGRFWFARAGRDWAEFPPVDGERSRAMADADGAIEGPAHRVSECHDKAGRDRSCASDCRDALAAARERSRFSSTPSVIAGKYRHSRSQPPR